MQFDAGFETRLRCWSLASTRGVMRPLVSSNVLPYTAEVRHLNAEESRMRFVPACIKSNRAILALWRTIKDPYLDPISRVIAAAMPKWRRQVVVQIGVNDGARDDPLYALLKARPRWRALLVEPLPEYFDQLKMNYGVSPRFMYEMSAVGTEDGSLPFYHIAERGRESAHWLDYFDRIGSLCRQDLIMNLGDRAEAMASYIVETPVNVISMESLMQKWAIDRIDALVIDAEGYDWKILQSVLDMGMRPRVLMFEYTHLSQAEHAVAMERVLIDYAVATFARDHVCVRRAAAR